MLYNITHRYPRAYVHRHKLHVLHAQFKQVGQSEVMMLVAQIDKLVQSTPLDKTPTIIVNQKKIYFKPPHLVANNFFSGDLLMD